MEDKIAGTGKDKKKKKYINSVINQNNIVDIIKSNVESVATVVDVLIYSTNKIYKYITPAFKKRLENYYIILKYIAEPAGLLDVIFDINKKLYEFDAKAVGKEKFDAIIANISQLYDTLIQLNSMQMYVKHEIFNQINILVDLNSFLKSILGFIDKLNTLQIISLKDLLIIRYKLYWIKHIINHLLDISNLVGNFKIAIKRAAIMSVIKVTIDVVKNFNQLFKDVKLDVLLFLKLIILKRQLVVLTNLTDELLDISKRYDKETVRDIAIAILSIRVLVFLIVDMLQDIEYATHVGLRFALKLFIIKFVVAHVVSFIKNVSNNAPPLSAAKSMIFSIIAVKLLLHMLMSIVEDVHNFKLNISNLIVLPIKMWWLKKVVSSIVDMVYIVFDKFINNNQISFGNYRNLLTTIVYTRMMLFVILRTIRQVINVAKKMGNIFTGNTIKNRIVFLIKAIRTFISVINGLNASQVAQEAIKSIKELFLNITSIFDQEAVKTEKRTWYTLWIGKKHIKTRFDQIRDAFAELINIVLSIRKDIDNVKVTTINNFRDRISAIKDIIDDTVDIISLIDREIGVTYGAKAFLSVNVFQALVQYGISGIFNTVANVSKNIESDKIKELSDSMTGLREIIGAMSTLFITILALAPLATLAGPAILALKLSFDQLFILLFGSKSRGEKTEEYLTQMFGAKIGGFLGGVSKLANTWGKQIGIGSLFGGWYKGLIPALKEISEVTEAKNAIYKLCAMILSLGTLYAAIDFMAGMAVVAVFSIWVLRGATAVIVKGLRSTIELLHNASLSRKKTSIFPGGKASYESIIKMIDRCKSIFKNLAILSAYIILVTPIVALAAVVTVITTAATLLMFGCLFLIIKIINIVTPKTIAGTMWNILKFVLLVGSIGLVAFALLLLLEPMQAVVDNRWLFLKFFGMLIAITIGLTVFGYILVAASSVLAPAMIGIAVFGLVILAMFGIAHLLVSLSEIKFGDNEKEAVQTLMKNITDTINTLIDSFATSLYTDSNGNRDYNDNIINGINIGSIEKYWEIFKSVIAIFGSAGLMWMSLITVAAVWGIAKMLNSLQDVTLNGEAIKNNVGVVIGVVKHLVHCISEPIEKEKQNEESKGFWDTIKGAVGTVFDATIGNFINVIQTLGFVGVLGTSYVVLAMITSIVSNLKKIENLETFNETTISNNIESVVRTVNNVLTKLKEKPKGAELNLMDSIKEVISISGTVKFGLFKSLLTDLADISKVKFVSMGDTDKALEEARQVVDFHKNFIEIINGADLEKMNALQGAYNASKSHAGFIQTINNADLKKLETTTNMFKYMAEFSKSINGNFDDLTRTIAEKLMPLLNELKELLEDIPDKIEKSSADVSASVFASNTYGGTSSTYTSFTPQAMEAQVKREQPKLTKEEVGKIVDERMSDQAVARAQSITTKIDELMEILKSGITRVTINS